MDETAGMGGGGLLGLILTATPETKAVLAICAIFSLASWYIIGSTWHAMRGLDRDADTWQRTIERARTLADREQAAASLPRSPFAALLRTAADYLGDLQAANERAGVSRTGLSLTQLEGLTLVLDAEVRATAADVGHRVGWLATIGATAPLLGLLGTVLGIMGAFLGIAEQGSGNIAAVAPGIADALVATAAGLAAAIPAVVAYNVFTARIERFEGQLERAAQDAIGALGREGRL